VTRTEDNGSMNSVPVRVYARRGRRERLLAVVLGGETACVPVAAASLSLQARSFHPYDHDNKNPDACRSRRLRMRPGAKRESWISVSPKSARSTYLCGWTVEPTDLELALFGLGRRPNLESARDSEAGP
jgi:hypothetical protein